MSDTFFSQANFQPKRKFRFIVSFPGLGEGLNYMATTADKPGFEQAEKSHNVLNHVFKFPGIVKWNDVKVSFVDSFSPDVGFSFYQALQNMGYVEPKTKGALTTGITKLGAHTSLGLVKIQQLDGGAVDAVGTPQNARIQEQWTLNNAFLKSVAFGDLSYESEDLVTINSVIVYDWATYERPGNQVMDA